MGLTLSEASTLPRSGRPFLSTATSRARSVPPRAVGVTLAAADSIRPLEPESGEEAPQASGPVDHEANGIDVAAAAENLVVHAGDAHRDVAIALLMRRGRVLARRRGGRQQKPQGKGHGGQRYRRAALDACVVAPYWADGGFPLPRAAAGAAARIMHVAAGACVPALCDSRWRKRDDRTTVWRGGPIHLRLMVRLLDAASVPSTAS